MFDPTPASLEQGWGIRIFNETSLVDSQAQKKFKNLLKGSLLPVLHTVLSESSFLFIYYYFLTIYCFTLRSLILLVAQLLDQNSKSNNFSWLVFFFHLPNSVDLLHSLWIHLIFRISPGFEVLLIFQLKKLRPLKI